MGLQHNFTCALGTSGAACDLNQQLREFFAAAEIGGKQALVDADHAGEGEVRQVMAFGEHLGTDQDAGALA